MSKHSDQDNHADQLNPNNDAFWQSRDWDERPEDWGERIAESEDQDQKPPDSEVSEKHR